MNNEPEGILFDDSGIEFLVDSAESWEGGKGRRCPSHGLPNFAGR
jgi:hypothetical protein